MQKPQYWKYFARSKIFHLYEKLKLLHSRAPLFILFLIAKLQDLTSSNRTIIWKIAFLKKLLWITSSKNKNIGNIWRKVRSFIHMKKGIWLMHELLPLANYRTLQVMGENCFKIAFVKMLDCVICSKKKKTWNTAWNTEIRPCRSLFSPSFVNSEIKVSYKLLPPPPKINK